MNQDLFRAGMARLAGAVNIVASDGEFGKGGITATAVCSVSDTPPCLLVCVNTGNGLNSFIKANQHFSVNLLGTSHQELANRFAGFDKVAMSERFEKGDWETLTTGSPILTNSLVSFDCRLTGFQEMGTHTVMFGDVLNVKINEEQLEPLLYFARKYNTVKV
ncbi:MAG: flavin reductase [Arenicella sp.]|jgi:flavin reductase